MTIDPAGPHRAALSTLERPDRAVMLVMFTYLLGGALAGSTADYLQTVLPGILVLTITMTTQSTAVALNADIGRGVFDRFRSLPIWQPAPLVGALLADVARYVIAATVIVGAGVLLGFRPGAGVAGLVAVLGPLTMRLYRRER
ncbi:ABC transporter permease [Nocardia sp. NPDC003693]